MPRSPIPHHPTSLFPPLLALLLLAAGGVAPAAGQAGRVIFDGPEIAASGNATVSDGTRPRLAPVGEGGFALLWDGGLPEGESGSLYRVFGSAGTAPAPARASTADNPRERARIVRHRDGGFAILHWRRSDALGNQLLVMVLYHPDGRVRGGPFSVAGPVRESRPLAVSGAPEGGRVVAAWTLPATADRDGPAHVVAQRIGPSGSPEGGEIRVSQRDGSVGGLDIAVAADGSFAVLWTEDSSGGIRRTLIRRFAPDGSPLGPPVPVSPADGGASLAGALALDPEGGLWVAFSTVGDPRTRIWLRRFAADGAPGPALAVGEGSPGIGTASELGVAVSGDGTVIVTWATHPPMEESSEMAEVVARAFSADGSPLGEPFRVHRNRAGEQRFPAVAALSPSRFALTWRSNPGPALPVEVRARIVSLEPGRAGGGGEPPRALEPLQVGCDEARLRGLLARLRVEVGPGGTGASGVVVGPTRSGDFAGVAHAASSGPSRGETVLSFATNPEETPLLRNPERPPLPSVSLARIPPASDLVPAGSDPLLRVILDPTLEVSDPEPAALLVIDNVAGAAGVSADAKPGRGLLELLGPCHEGFVEADAHVFRVLRRIVRGEAAEAASFEAAVYRGEEPGLYRVDLYPRTADGRSLGRLAADLEIELTPDGRLWTGVLRLRPRCGEGVTVGCTSVAAPTVLKLVAPTFGAPPAPPPEVRVEASGGEGLRSAVRFSWAELLAGTTWLEAL